MAKVHDRVLEIKITTANGAQTVAVTALNYFRDRSQIDANNPFAITFTGGGAATSPVEITLGELLPPPTHIKVTATIGA